MDGRTVAGQQQGPHVPLRAPAHRARRVQRRRARRATRQYEVAQRCQLRVRSVDPLLLTIVRPPIRHGAGRRLLRRDSGTGQVLHTSLDVGAHTGFE